MNVIAFIVVTVLVSCIQASQVEQELLAQVMNRYDARIRPSDDANDLVLLSVGLYLNKLRNIDEVKGTVDMSLWVDMHWQDSRLSWRPSDFRSVKKLIIPTSQLWVPDLMLYTGNGVVEESLGANDKYHAIVEQTGAVTYTFPVNKVIQCLSQTGEQSFECNFEIEPWATDKDLMSVRTFSPVIDLSMMDNNLDKAYSIRNTTVEVKASVYPVGDERFDTIRGKIILERKK